MLLGDTGGRRLRELELLHHLGGQEADGGAVDEKKKWGGERKSDENVFGPPSSSFALAFLILILCSFLAHCVKWGVGLAAEVSRGSEVINCISITPRVEQNLNIALKKWSGKHSTGGCCRLETQHLYLYL